MKNCFITVSTLTAAQMAEASLRRAGIYCKIQRSPRWMAEKGCGNGILIDYERLERCISILRNNRIPFKKVYLRDEDGTMEELSV